MATQPFYVSAPLARRPLLPGQPGPLAPLPAGPMPPQVPPSPPVDPLAALPEAPTSVNQGINSVGRPMDENEDIVADTANAAAEVALGEKAANKARLLKKLRRQGKGEALMAFGAAMLSAPNFGQGLAKGLMAYQTSFNATKDDLKPKSVAVAGGAFNQITDFEGDSTFERTPVADYEEGKLDRITGRQLSVEDRKQTGRLEVEGVKQDGRMDLAGFNWKERGSIAKLDRTSRENITAARNDAGLAIARIRGASGGKVNAGMERQITDLSNDVVMVNDSLSRAAPILSAIKTGKLTFSLLSNARHKLTLGAGVGVNEEGRLYAQYGTLKESLRGAYLMAFKGVQTEGDAQRAFDAIFPSEGDTKSVQTALETVVRRIQEQSATNQSRLGQIGNYRTPQGTAAPAASPDRAALKSRYNLE